MSQCKKRELVCVPVLGGYDIRSRNCGETYGSAATAT